MMMMVEGSAGQGRGNMHLITMLLVVLGCTAAFGVSPNTLSPGFAFVGADIVGTSLQNTTASSALACASLCDTSSSCVAWSWNSCSGSTACSLFSTASTYAANTCRICNAKVGQIGVDRTLAGADIAGFNPYVLPASSTASICANLCANVTNCVAWSFDSQGKQNCWLKNSIAITTTNNPARISGVQGIINMNTPYLGIDTIILPASASATQCADFCAATPGCKVWLYEVPGNGCNVNNAGLCWAKSSFYYSGIVDKCYIAGKQNVSTAAPKTINRITPANITNGLPKNVVFPFKRLVVFGDNLSDNGNGSYAHCVADRSNCQNSIYGFRTWTNGPIAASFLAGYLNMSLTTDYAYGHADGGSKFGATIDNNYTQSTANAPSLKDQIVNYTTTSPGLSTTIGTTLHFVWIGANDINLYHINTNSANNSKFASEFSNLLAQRVQSLISAGAQYVFVANLYPKHISPSVTFYASNPTQVANLGAAIASANDAIKSVLSSFGAKVIYYDAYTFMLNVYNNHTSYGITHVNGEFCDGYSQLDWELCVTDAQGETFYWMQYLDMTSYVHHLVAADMYSTIVKKYSS